MLLQQTEVGAQLSFFLTRIEIVFKMNKKSEGDVFLNINEILQRWCETIEQKKQNNGLNKILSTLTSKKKNSKCIFSKYFPKIFGFSSFSTRKIASRQLFLWNEGGNWCGGFRVRGTTPKLIVRAAADAQPCA